MNKKTYSLFLFITLILAGKNSSAQCAWSTVGSGAASSPSLTAHNDMAFSSTDQAYISYIDQSISNAVSVKTFSAGVWNSIGSLSTNINSSFTSIALNGSVPYVAFADGNNSNRLTVKTYSAGTWNSVGTTLSTSTASYVSMSIYAGAPYVAYVDVANSSKATVKTYSAGAWSTLGTAVSTSSASYTSLSIDNTGTPYIIYVDVANSNTSTVKKYNGTAWVAVGTGTLAANVSETKIDVSYNNTPYVAWTGGSYVGSIKTFTAGSWQSVGTGTVSNVYSYLSLAVDASGTPYLAYYDLGPYKANVQKFDGSTWAYIGGSSGISVNAPSYNALAINSKATPYLTYADGSSGAYVKQLGSPTTVSNPSPMTLCVGSGGIMSVAVTNTVAGMSYQWQVNTGAGFTNVINGSNYSGATTPSLTLSAITTAFNTYQYRCIVNAVCSNIISGSALLTVNTNPTLTVTSATICAGASATLSAAGATTYNWNTGPTTSNIVVSPISTTAYTVTGTSSGCTATATTTVIVNPAPVAGMNSNSPICAGSTINFINTSTGTISSYAWNGPGGFTSTLQNPLVPNATAANAGTYTQTVTTVNGCTGTASINVIVNPLPTLVVTPTNTNICAGGSATLSASGATTYNWNTGATTISTVVTPTVTSTYTVTGTNAAGCTKTASASVVVNPKPVVTLASTSATLCLTDSVTLTASGAMIYSWNTGATTTTIKVSPTITTSYSVIGSNTFGCKDTVATTISVTASKTFSGNVISPGGPQFGNMVLYKYSPTLSQWDSVTYSPYFSTYNFSIIDKGDYVLKAIPAASSLQVTYGSSSISWQSANITTHGCLTNSSPSVSVIALSVFTSTGSGILSGTVVEAHGFGTHKTSSPMAPGSPIGGIVVKGGKNPGGQMYVQTTTGADGTYTLTGLPDNTINENYFVFVDIAGLDTNLTYHEVLNGSNNHFYGLDFTVDSIYINPKVDVGVHDKNSIEHQVKVFPNPTRSYVNIEYQLLKESNVKIDLFNIVGDLIKNVQPEIKQQMNTYKTNIKTENMDPGLYFIKIKIDNGESVIKLLIND